MFHFLFFILLYFLPSIIGRDKKDALGIFLVNLLLGWTVVGWVLALLWACASDRQATAQYAPAGGGRFCSHCGTLVVGPYCPACGARV